MENINATLTSIRFQDRDTGFIIGTFRGEKEFAALGSIVGPEIGLEYKLYGEWSNDPKWGRQYKFSNYETIAPKSTDGIFRYLVKVAKWVGPKIGQALIDQYKEETLDIIRIDPERVARQIRGITPERAAEMQAKIIENQAIEATLVELENLIGGQGLKQSLPTELLAKYGSNAVAIVKENPYRLTEIKYVGFGAADHVALTKFGIKPASVRRQQAACVHTLEGLVFGEGHIWIEVKTLTQAVMDLIGCDPAQGLEKLVSNGAVIVDGGMVALKRMAKDEELIAEKIRELSNARKL